MDEILDEEKKSRWIRSIKTSGIPLQLKTEKIFRNREFSAYNWYWTDEANGERKNRELDVFAHKVFNVETEFFNCELDVHAFVSCMYRKDYAYFLFEGTGPKLLQKFPIINSPKILGTIVRLWKIEELGFFPVIVGHNIHGCEIEHLDKPTCKFSDKGIYNCSNESLACMENFYTNRVFSDTNELIDSQIPSEFRSIILDFVKEEKISRPDIEYAAHTCSIKKNKELLDILRVRRPYIRIDVGFPLVVTEGEVFKVLLNESGEPSNIEKIGYGLYLHRPESNTKWSILEHIPILPVIVTNANYLDTCAKIIENVSNSIREEVGKRLRARNYVDILTYMLERTLKVG